jgi:hypothetical protein
VKRWIVVGVAAVALGGASAAQANTPRYASVSPVSTDACTADAPCSIQAAINGTGANPVHAGDEVIVLPGTYGSSDAPTPALSDTTGTPVHIHGQAGAARPLILSNAISAAITLNDPGSSLSHVAVESVAPAGGIAINLQGGSASDVVAATSTNNGVACEVLGSLSDAICSSAGISGAAIEADTSSVGTQTVSPAIHGVTAWASGTGSDGLRVHGTTDSPIPVHATNTIFHGASDVDASGPSTVTLDHDSFATVAAGPSAAVTPAGTAGNVGAAQLVAPANANFRELPTSPTVDSGAPDASALDVYGGQRTLGHGTDIGAAELVPAPGALATGASSVTDTTATVTGFVDPEGLPTVAHFLYGTTPGTGSHTLDIPAGTAAGAKRFSVQLTGLRPNQTYYVRLQATSVGGTTISPLSTFKTPDAFHGLTIRTSHVRVSAKHTARVSFSCPKGTPVHCTGTLTLTLAGHRAGRAHFNVAAGKSGHATIKLARRAQATVARHTKVKVRASAAAKDGIGRKKTTKKTISLLRR